MALKGTLDIRFSQATEPVSWQQVRDALTALDVVVEGMAERLTGRDVLAAAADAIREKYSGDWDFTPETAKLYSTRCALELSRVECSFGAR